jgi:hypothetical protein
VLSQPVAWKLAILLAAVTIALFFVIPAVAKRYGPRVAERFLERDVSYVKGEFHDWVIGNRALARGYASPVLFPLDLIFMTCLGGFLAIASGALLAHAGASSWCIASSLVFPLAYIAIDLAEDVLLARMLRAPERIEALIGPAKVLTMVKLGVSFVAVVQTIVLAAWALAWAR